VYIPVYVSVYIGVYVNVNRVSKDGLTHDALHPHGLTNDAKHPNHTPTTQSIPLTQSVTVCIMVWVVG